MNVAYNTSLKLVSQLHADVNEFVSLTSAKSSTSTATPPTSSTSSLAASHTYTLSLSDPKVQSLQASITSHLTELRRCADELEDMAKKEITALKREKAFNRSTKIRTDFTSLKNTFESHKQTILHQQKQQQQQELIAKQRDDLLNRRTNSNVVHAAHQNGNGSSIGGILGTSSYDQGGQHLHPLHVQDSTSIHMGAPMGSTTTADYFSQESRSLNSVETRLDEYLLIARNSLNELMDQRTLLKTTQKRLLDVANSLGLSQTVIRIIEQRTTQDKYIFWGGVGVTLLVIFLIIYYIV